MPWLPGLLFGGLSIGGSLLILFLPETLNRPLPQTIEDVENWSKKPKDKSAAATEPREKLEAAQCIESMNGVATPAKSIV